MRSLVFLGTFVFLLQVQAQVLLQRAQEEFFNPASAPRVGLEVELAGLSVDRTVEILKSVLGGKITDNLVYEHYIDPITREDVRYTVTEKILVGSKIGDIKVKPEDNVISNANLKNAVAQTPLVEIVTSPIYVESVPAFQEAIDEIRRQGALGTSDGFAVAIQVNVEIAQGIRENMKPSDLLNLLRNYLNAENHRDIAREINVAAIRERYLGEYTKGMMKRIMNPSYQPNWGQFHFDFMYRQSLELLGYGESSWTKSRRQVKKLLQKELEAKGFESILRVVKWNNLRISSLFMFLYPNDWLTKYLIETTWFHKYPIIEFREPNSDFRVKDRVEQLVGFIQQSEVEGAISLDSAPVAGFMCRQIFSK